MQSKLSYPAEYVEQMTLLLDLQLNPEHRPAVVENFALNYGIHLPELRSRTLKLEANGSPKCNLQYRIPTLENLKFITRSNQFWFLPERWGV